MTCHTGQGHRRSTVTTVVQGPVRQAGPGSDTLSRSSPLPHGGTHYLWSPSLAGCSLAWPGCQPGLYLQARRLPALTHLALGPAGPGSEYGQSHGADTGTGRGAHRQPHPGRAPRPLNRAKSSMAAGLPGASLGSRAHPQREAYAAGQTPPHVTQLLS